MTAFYVTVCLLLRISVLFNGQDKSRRFRLTWDDVTTR